MDRDERVGSKMKKILIIEDEPDLCESIAEIIEMHNFKSLTAENGIEGLEYIKEELPDLVLCDVDMPGIDGYGVLSALRQNPKTMNLPLIFITGKDQRDDVRLGMKLGADDYLTKPFTATELMNAIAIRLERKAAIDKKAEEKLDELRNQIALTLPHELNTPLNGILGMTAILREEFDTLEAEEAVEMLDSIQNSALRLYRLTQNCLVYAQLELIASDPKRRAALLSQPDSCYPKTAIAELALRIAKAANREGDLKLNLPNTEVKIYEPHFQKIAEEIIDNAFKFSLAGTPVEVCGEISNDWFKFYVCDRGRGINPEQIASVGAYMQFDRKLYQQQGSGLGLVIAKRMTQLHGGDFRIESIPGVQTTVTVTLPNK